MRKTLLLIGIAISCPAAANAAGPKGPYVSLGASLSHMKDVNNVVFNAPVPGGKIDVINEMDDSAGVSGAIGYDLGLIRVEGELGRTWHDGHHSVAVTPFPGRELDQYINQSETRAMANAAVTLGSGTVRPFAGAGIGKVWVDAETYGPRLPFPTEGWRSLIDQRIGKTAYQLFVGAEFRVAPNVGLTLKARRFDAGTIEGEDSRGEPFTRQHRSNNLDLGFRIGF